MDTNSEMHTHPNFYAMLTAACQKNGNGTVIFNDKEKISYSSLKREVETVAAYLQHEGVQYGDRVALVVSNSPEFIAAYFAITSIGAVAVPLNVFLKSEEFSYILNDCGARFMFASAPLAKELKNIKAKTKVNKIIWIGETKAASGDDSYFDAARTFPGKPNLSRQPSANDLAHIIYTSGTTGHPKGALISLQQPVFQPFGYRTNFPNFAKRPLRRLLAHVPQLYADCHGFTADISSLLDYFGQIRLPVLQRVETGFAQTRYHFPRRTGYLHCHEQSQNPLVFQMV